MDPITWLINTLIPSAAIQTVTNPNGVVAAGVNGTIAVGDTVGSGIDAVTNAAANAANSVWANVEPWVIGIAILLGLLLVSNVLSDVKEL